MANDLLELLAQKRFDELLKRLDDSASRQRLLAELEPVAGSEAEADSPAGDGSAEQAQADRIWDEVAAGQLHSHADNENAAFARQLAVSLGAYNPLRAWLGGLKWGQIAASGLTMAALTALFFMLMPPARTTLPESFPNGALLASVNKDIKPLVNDANRDGLALVLDYYGNTTLKGTEPGLDRELLRLLMIYRPSPAELQAVRQALGLSGEQPAP